MDRCPTATDLTFLIAGKPAFDIPLSHIHNTSINKTEVALEIARPDLALAGGAEMPSKRRRKLEAQDQLIEVRLYIPGSEATARRRAKKAKKAEEAEAGADGAAAVTGDETKPKKEEDEESEEEDEDVEMEGDPADPDDMSAAQVFHDTLKERAEIGQVSGDSIVTFAEVACATPRFVWLIRQHISS